MFIPIITEREIMKRETIEGIMMIGILTGIIPFILLVIGCGIIGVLVG